MNQQEWANLVESLRIRAGKPNNTKLATILNEQYPKLAVATLQGIEWIGSFRSGSAQVREAAYHQEPQLTYLLLFLEQLKPTPDEKRKLFSYIEEQIPESLKKYASPILDYQI
jgi:hypothetical protein